MRVNTIRMAGLQSEISTIPQVTVVATLTYPRGQVKKFLASWETQRGFPRDQIEVILVSNGTDPPLEIQVRELLHSHDRLIHAPGLPETELYNLGVTHARAEWVLITEPHVVASADCLSELMSTVTQSHLEGACVRTVQADDENWVAECESRMYASDLEVLSDPHDWRKITKRGTLFLRRIFLDADGFPARYGAYSEMVLAETLSRQGHRLGFAARATIRHYNSTDLQELLDYIWDYRQGACLYQQDHLNDSLNSSSSTLMNAAGQVEPQPRRIIRNCIRHSFFHGLLKRPALRSLWTMLKTWSFVSFPNLLMRSKAGRLRLSCWLNRCRLVMAPSRNSRYERFMELWTRWGDLAELRHRAEDKTAWPQSGMALNKTHSVSAADLLPAVSLGVHQIEQHQHEKFRWLEPVACFSFQGEPASYIVTLKFLKLHVPRSRVRCYWNQTLLHPIAHGSEQELIFQILPGDFVDSERQLLTITSPPQRTSRDELRRLGLPMVGVGFQSAKLAPDQPAEPARSVA